MSFTNLRTQTRNRYNEVLIFLNYIILQEPTPPTPIPEEVKIMRGLFFVHLYGTFEKSVNGMVQKTIALVDAKNVKHRHFAMPFNTIALVNKLKSLKDSGHGKLISKAVELFEEINCIREPSLNETAFSRDLQNVWAKTITTVNDSFGIKNFTITTQERATIDELVENRNKIAHGREKPSIVGSTHMANQLKDKLDLITDFNYKMIDEFEVYFNRNKVEVMKLLKSSIITKTKNMGL